MLSIGFAAAGATLAQAECAPYTTGFLGQPVNTVTSLAFVVAGVAIAVAARDGSGRSSRFVFATLVAATGVGSVVQHGPNPSWADLAHDLPLAALVVFVAVDAGADVLDRRALPVSWAAPTAALAPLILVAPSAADVAQAGLALVAGGLSAQRARLDPHVRRPILLALSLFGVGAVIGTLSRSGWPLCDAGDPLRGHAVWHVLAAGALWTLAPVIGRRHRRL